ncbi:RagB/SusD family nutrient uptake outer membrane protein [Pedobacter jeongneungensis]|uniref:RagB/SusD family nutrient uptake outer membrane protein n=1 Tax=Pedobacter jeongneungensis TaxID=947309 RepID=UPI0013B43FDA|nr:RagB/SusD family nutrient uptake outer membrane protein [Pedobacter jeongneungensis]
MKKIQLIGLMFLIMFSSSCKKFLTVEPATVTTADKLFASPQGYTDALAGIYIGMRKNYSPAAFLNSGGTDFMAQLWYYPAATATNGVNYQLAHHLYKSTEVDAALNTMFLNQYNTILNTNTLLNALTTQNVLEERLAKCTEGEGLAIRAFVHFDLMRLFGPIPSNPGSKGYLPYVTTVDKSAYSYDSYSNYMAKLTADLDKAEQLLATYDPISKYSPASLNRTFAAYTEYQQQYWYWRQNRMNYYAVLGLQARVRLWMGDKVNAARYAKMVIDAVDPNGAKKFTFGVRSNLSSRNYVFFTEHLFGLNIENFNDALVSSGSQATQVIQQSKIISDLYQSETSDLRYALFYSISTSYFSGNASSTKKYADLLAATTTVPNSNVFSIPMIRLSEMYLIMMECSSLTDANTYYTAYRTAREVAPITLTETNRQDILIREYIKDFYAEGQIFYLYKRLGITNMMWSDHSTGEAEYVLPLPSREIGLGQ